MVDFGLIQQLLDSVERLDARISAVEAALSAPPAPPELTSAATATQPAWPQTGAPNAAP